MLDFLEYSLTEYDILEAIDTVPPTFEGVYERILQQF